VKVAFGADQLWASVPGGIGTYVRELAPALAASDGVDLSLWHCRSAGAGPEPAWLGMFDTMEVPGPIRTLYPQWNLLGRPKLPPMFEGLEVVHATGPAGVPAVRRGSALVVTVHDLAHHRFPERFPTPWRLLYGAGVRAAVKRADAILVPSQATADDIVNLTGADPSRVHVTPLAAALPATNGDPAEATTRLGVRTPYVLFVGTLEPRKNVVQLVRAYRQIAPEVPHALVLAGPDGWHIRDLDDELAREGPGSVVRTGRVSDRDLDTLYRGADLFAYPSAFEGFGLPVLEAMARGVPVVTSDTPALTELTGDAAVRVEADDVAGLADALAQVLSDPELTEDLRARGIARAGAYAWDLTARATLDAYRSAIGACS
jgi:glycosyltransferase involved in cell wall biosynthesis